SQVYADKNKVAGVGFNDVGAGSKPAQEQRAGLEPAPTVLDVNIIYQRYLQAFKKGVFNYIKEETVEPATCLPAGRLMASLQEQQKTPRKYFSGGENFTDRAMISALTYLPSFEPPDSPDAMRVVVDATPVDLPDLDGQDSKSNQMETWSTDATMTAKVDQEALDRLKKDPKATVWSDQKGFNGVSLEHFVVALRQLIQKDLSPQKLQEVLLKLGLIKPEENMSYDNTATEKYYKFIYQALASQGFSKEILDIVNEDSYDDPRLSVAIVDQNGNPKVQAILEAVSNSIDALGGDIGQFSKGVKQIIDWLEPNGVDRVDVISRQANKSAYHLSIINAPNGQWYIQIKEATNKEIKAASPQGLTQGTVVDLSFANSIPMGNSKKTEVTQRSLLGLQRAIHDRFQYVKNIGISTIIGSQVKDVNGWETRRFIHPFNRPVPGKADKKDRDIRIDLSSKRIRIMDNGRGMGILEEDALAKMGALPRMFVPLGTDREPKVLRQEKDIREELDKKLTLVHDTREDYTKEIATIDFARSEEVIYTTALEGINPLSIISGKLMLDIGGLFSVQQDRGKIIFSPKLDSQGNPLILRGIIEVVDRLLILQEDQMTREDKLKYINTIIAGLEKLIAGNPNNEIIVDKIRRLVKERISSLVKSLMNEGAFVLPHEESFAQIKIPDNRKVFYLNSRLFDWNRIATFKNLGGEVVDRDVMSFIRMVHGEKQSLNLIAVPFKEEFIHSTQEFDGNTYPFKSLLPTTVISGDSFIAIPYQFSGRFLELARLRLKGQGMDKELSTQFHILGQLIKGKVDDETVTSYEVAPVANTVELPPIDPAKFKVYEGGDQKAIKKFLTSAPPQVTMRIPEASTASPMSAIPSDAKMRLMINADGDLVDILTGKVKVRGKGDAAIVKDRDQWEIIDMEALGHDHYLITRKSGSKDLVINNGKEVARHGMKLSPKRGFVYEENPDSWPLIFNVETGQLLEIEKQNSVAVYEKFQFSSDDRFVSYVESSNNKHILKVYDLKEKSEILSTTVDNIDYQFHPTASVIRVNDSLSYDLSTGEAVEMKGRVYTHASGIVSVAVDNDVIKIHHFAGGKHREFDRTSFNNSSIGLVRIGNDGEISVSTGGFKSFLITPSGKKTVFEGAGFTGYEEIERDFYLVLSESNLTLARVPIHEYDPTKIYKHPQFNLIIDKRDPDKSVAIDIKTDKSIQFKGEIIKVRDGPAAGEFRLGALLEGKTYEYSSKDPDKPYADFSYRLDNGQPPVFKVLIDKDQKNYYLLGSKSGALLAWSKVGITQNLYPQVYFDGKYFVFTNSQTRQVAYLNPKEPDKSIFVEPKSSSPLLPASAAAFPPKANLKVYITPQGDLADLQTGEVRVKGEKGNEIIDVEALGHNNYFITRRNGVKQVMSQGSEDVFPSDYQKTNVALTFSSKKGFIYPSQDLPIEHLAIFDVKAGKLRDIEFYKDFIHFMGVQYQNIQISADERFMAYVVHSNDGTYTLRVYDLQAKQEVLNVPVMNPTYAFHPIASVLKFNDSVSFDFSTGKAIPMDGKVSPIKIYRHPQYDIIVDKRDPNKPMAIDTETGQKVQFKGDIINVNRYKDGEFFVSTFLNGRHYLYSSFDQIGEPRSAVSAKIDNNLPSRFQVFLGKNEYEVVSENKVLIYLSKVEITPKLFPQFYFDGTYFVFINPETRKTAYLDPHHPDTPFFYNPTGNPSSREFLTEEKPDDTLAPNKDEQILFQRKADELWNRDVLGDTTLKQGRDYWIAQAQEGYKGLLKLVDALVPEDFQSDIKKSIHTMIEAIYPRQETGIRETFKAGFMEGAVPEKISFDDKLPFKEISRRLTRCNNLLQEKDGEVTLLESLVRKATAGEFKSAESSLRSLFDMILNLSTTTELELTPEMQGREPLSTLLRASLLGWNPLNPIQLQNTSTMGIFLGLLDELHVSMDTQRKMVSFLSEASLDESKAPIVFKQIKRFLPSAESLLSKEKQMDYLTQFAKSFEKANLPSILEGLKDDRRGEKLGDAMAFIKLFTMDINTIKTKKRFEPKGTGALVKDEKGAGLDQITNAYPTTIKTFQDLMSNFESVKEKPAPSGLTGGIQQLIVAQKEPGGEKVEFAQNSKDAGAKNLTVEYYKDDEARESIEEIRDDGLGPENPLALFVVGMSTKKNKQQLLQYFNRHMGGKYGTGMQTYYAGVDRVEYILNNGTEAYFVVVKVTDGMPNITEIREIDPKFNARGFLTRRIKKFENSIPELDQWLGQRSWTIFTGMGSGRDGFTISLIERDKQGKDVLKPIDIQRELLSEVKFDVGLPLKPGEELLPMRIWSQPAIDPEWLDKNGWRVDDLMEKKKFFALVPGFLKEAYIDSGKLGLTPEIPLDPYQNRSGYEREDEEPYSQDLPKYMAIELLRSLVYKTLMDESFVLEDFSRDWETSDSRNYWQVLKTTEGDQWWMDIVKKINDHEYDKISYADLEKLQKWLQTDHDKGKAETFMKFIVRIQAQVPLKSDPGKKVPFSLLERRVEVQLQVQEAEARRWSGLYGVDVDTIGRYSDPYAASRVSLARGLYEGHRKYNSEKMARQPKTLQEQALLELAVLVAGAVGFKKDKILLVDEEGCPFSGSFRGDGTMFINAALARQMDQDYVDIKGLLHGPTETIVHELAHYFEKRFALALVGQKMAKGEIFWADDNLVTHQNKGPFAKYYQMISGVALAKLNQLWGGNKKVDSAMTSHPKANEGGINLGSADQALEVQHQDGEIKFHLDAAQLAQLQESPGLTPVIVSIEPMLNLKEFLNPAGAKALLSS
ncbi:MAG: hypothetical protein HQL15_08430, partial [Candidatus Omnitrophica bacterium]|nr:hypothetical protein [Candidatus Omnitrophota bacterium]